MKSISVSSVSDDVPPWCRLTGTRDRARLGRGVEHCEAKTGSTMGQFWQVGFSTMSTVALAPLTCGLGLKIQGLGPGLPSKSAKITCQAFS